MHKRLRTFLSNTPIRIALGLVAFYFLFAYLIFSPLARWAAGKYVAGKTGHTLTLGEARFDPLELSLLITDLKLDEPGGAHLLAFRELFMDLDPGGIFRWTWTFDSIRLGAPMARVGIRPDGSLNWSAFLEAFNSKEENRDQNKEEGEPTRLLVRSLTIERGRIEFADHKVAGGFETRTDPLDIQITELATLPEGKGKSALSARTLSGATISLTGDFTLTPLAATGELVVDGFLLSDLWPYFQDRVRIAPPEGKAKVTLAYRFEHADTGPILKVENIGAELEGLSLRGPENPTPAITLGHLALNGGRFDIDGREIFIDGIDLKGGHIGLTRLADGRLDIEDWFPAGAEEKKAPEAAPVRNEAGAPNGAGKEERPWKFRLGRLNLDGISASLADRGFASSLNAEADNVRVSLKAEAEMGPGEPAGMIEGLGIEVSGIRLISGAMPEPVFSLESFTVEDGRAELAGREAKVGRIALKNGRTALAMDARGNLNLAEVFRKVSSGGPAASQKTSPGPDSERPWNFRVEKVEAEGFQVALREGSVSPAAVLHIEDLRADADGVSGDLKAGIPIRISFIVREGGRFEADGTVIPMGPAAELRIKLTDFALLPMQPYLSKATHLTIAGGKAGTGGRLSYHEGRPSYMGGFTVRDLLLNETETKKRFLAWKALSADGFKADMEKLDIKELKLEGPKANLLIYKDKSTNIKKVLKDDGNASAKASPPQEKTDGAKPPASAISVEKTQKGSPYQVNIGRVRVLNGEMDFADLSLALPFRTRIHGLKGNIGKISTGPGTTTAVKLDGLVDDYGLARAAGKTNLLDPTGFTDIKVEFKNVEMTNLTPYSTTFAGRRIASGKLSLDLEYKLKDRQLLGENQIIMDKLTLGERVESPSAVNLPLDLAIAILKDSEGRIDLGLPVSGSLDDPQFSYGAVIWKAFVNVITGIATAPFRALGKVLGLGGGERMEDVVFEAGDAGLLPPEREKLKTLAVGMGKRPSLKLTLVGTYDEKTDSAAIRERELARTVAKEIGRKPVEAEEPDTVSTDQPEVREALEKLHAARIGKDAFKSLRSKYRQANPEQGPKSRAGRVQAGISALFDGGETPLTEEEAERLKGKDLHDILYQDLLETEKVGEDRLAALAWARAAAVRDELLAQGVSPDRLQVGGPEKVEGEGRDVPIRMDLGNLPDQRGRTKP